MKIVINGFIFSLIFSTTIFAATNTTTDGQITSETDVVAAADISTPAPQQNPETPILESPANTVSEKVTSQTEIPQQVQQPVIAQEKILHKESLPQEPLPTIAQENTNVAGSVGEVTIDPTVKSLTDRLVALETQNNTLQDQITQMTARVSLLEERLIGNVGEQKAQEHFQGNIGRLKSYMGAKLFKIVISSIVVIFLLLLVYIIFPRRKDSAPVNYPQDNLPNKECDFNPMEGQDGNVAKLNLARAYVEMGNESKAQGILYDVLAHGNDAEQAEAKTLLEKIKRV